MELHRDYTIRIQTSFVDKRADNRYGRFWSMRNPVVINDWGFASTQRHRREQEILGVLDLQAGVAPLGVVA